MVCGLICYIAWLVWSGRGRGFDLVEVDFWEFRYITISKMLFNMSLDVDVSPQCHHNNALCAQTRSRHQCCRAAPRLIITCHPSVPPWSWSGPAICVVISIGITHIVHYCHPPIIVLQLTICQPLVIIPSIMVLAITCNFIFLPDGSSSLNILMIIIQFHPPLSKAQRENTLKTSFWMEHGGSQH